MYIQFEFLIKNFSDSIVERPSELSQHKQISSNF